MQDKFGLDLSDFSKELKWMLLLLQNNRDKEEILSHIPVDMDWSLFLQLVMHHRVYPLVFTKLREMDSELIPEHVIESLSAEYKRNTFQMLQLSAELERVCKVFDEHGIRSLQLKGPVIAKELYGDISLRTSKDLDILVPFADIEKVEGILRMLGYVLTDEINRVLDDWKWRIHHLSYFHPGKRILIEMHWKQSPNITNEPSFDELWSRRNTSSFTKNGIHFLGVEDLFLYLVSHGARHSWFRLRWLADIKQLLNKEFEWEKVHSHLKRYDCHYLAGQALILANQLLATPIKQEIKPIMASSRSFMLAQNAMEFIKNMVELCVEFSDKKLAESYKIYTLSLMSKKQKWRQHLFKLFPSSADALALPLPKILHFLYFPLRPFLWCWRRLKWPAKLIK
ncbi:nucleotidyltransferase family protein [Paenibacillus sp. GCM10027628]|uniref:nucleotidyltransferase domain-containing protein n=1 Tax=Paenibacillus sp. GCM10027628 TaxID=3273413 RepID=UPI003625F5DA